MAPPAQSSKGSKGSKRRLEAQEGPSEADEHTGPRCDARPFEKEELKAMKLDDLRDIVNAQRDNINTPLPLKFKTYKANKPTLIDILLDPAYGFATRKPRLSFVPGFGVQKGAKRRKTAGAAATSKATPLVPDNQAGHSSDAMLNSAGMSMSGTTNYPSQGMNTFDVFMSNGGVGAGMSDVAGFDSSAFSGVPSMTFDGLYSFTSSSTLTLYIHDTRDAVLGHLPDMVQLTAPVSRNLLGQKVANWNEIIRELQKTASAISGENLKLSYARSAEDSYKVAIQKAHASSIDEAPIARPELILDRDPSVYHLYVESLDFGPPLVPRRASTPDVAAAQQTLARYSTNDKDTALRPFSEICKRGKARSLITQDAAARDKAWLEAALREWDGYEDFADTKHGMKKTYAEVASQWAFAVSFLNEYTHRKFPHSGKNVLARHIWSVVSRQGTWFRDAKEGHRLYQQYREHPEVVAAIQDTSLTGRAEFLTLLKRVAGL
ncbi:hypothetical protein EV121DRAFT_274601 [Schizophyllum commune]